MKTLIARLLGRPIPPEVRTAMQENDENTEDLERSGHTRRHSEFMDEMNCWKDDIAERMRFIQLQIDVRGRK